MLVYQRVTIEPALTVIYSSNLRLTVLEAQVVLDAARKGILQDILDQHGVAVGNAALTGNCGNFVAEAPTLGDCQKAATKVGLTWSYPFWQMRIIHTKTRNLASNIF